MFKNSLLKSHYSNQQAKNIKYSFFGQSSKTNFKMWKPT